MEMEPNIKKKTIIGVTVGVMLLLVGTFVVLQMNSSAKLDPDPSVASSKFIKNPLIENNFSEHSLSESEKLTITQNNSDQITTIVDIVQSNTGHKELASNTVLNIDKSFTLSHITKGEDDPHKNPSDIPPFKLSNEVQSDDESSHNVAIVIEPLSSGNEINESNKGSSKDGDKEEMPISGQQIGYDNSSNVIQENPNSSENPLSGTELGIKSSSESSSEYLKSKPEELPITENKSDQVSDINHSDKITTIVVQSNTGHEELVSNTPGNNVSSATNSIHDGQSSSEMSLKDNESSLLSDRSDPESFSDKVESENNGSENVEKVNPSSQELGPDPSVDNHGVDLRSADHKSVNNGKPCVESSVNAETPIDSQQIFDVNSSQFSTSELGKQSSSDNNTGDYAPPVPSDGQNERVSQSSNESSQGLSDSDTKPIDSQTDNENSLVPPHPVIDALAHSAKQNFNLVKTEKSPNPVVSDVYVHNQKNNRVISFDSVKYSAFDVSLFEHSKSSFRVFFIDNGGDSPKLSDVKDWISGQSANDFDIKQLHSDLEEFDTGRVKVYKTKLGENIGPSIETMEQNVFYVGMDRFLKSLPPTDLRSWQGKNLLFIVEGSGTCGKYKISMKKTRVVANESFSKVVQRYYNFGYTIKLYNYVIRGTKIENLFGNSNLHALRLDFYNDNNMVSNSPELIINRDSDFFKGLKNKEHLSDFDQYKAYFKDLKEIKLIDGFRVMYSNSSALRDDDIEKVLNLAKTRGLESAFNYLFEFIKFPETSILLIGDKKEFENYLNFVRQANK